MLKVFEVINVFYILINIYMYNMINKLSEISKFKDS